LTVRLEDLEEEAKLGTKAKLFLETEENKNSKIGKIEIFSNLVLSNLLYIRPKQHPNQIPEPLS
jgi:hypothetical protein